MTDPILCPWCGAEMDKAGYDIDYAMLCPECGARGPSEHTQEEAEASARERYVPQVKPLTLDELKTMDGEPVWIVAYPDWGHWELSEDAEEYLEGYDEDFYGLHMPKGMPDPQGRYGLHVLGWLAYRSKPTDEERAAEWEDMDG